MFVGKELEEITKAISELEESKKKNDTKLVDCTSRLNGLSNNVERLEEEFRNGL